MVVLAAVLPRSLIRLRAYDIRRFMSMLRSNYRQPGNSCLKLFNYSMYTRRSK